MPKNPFWLSRPGTALFTSNKTFPIKVGTFCCLETYGASHSSRTCWVDFKTPPPRLKAILCYWSSRFGSATKPVSVFLNSLTAVTARSSPSLHWGILQWALQHAEVARNNIFNLNIERFRVTNIILKEYVGICHISEHCHHVFRCCTNPHTRDVFTELSLGRFWWNTVCWDTDWFLFWQPGLLIRTWTPMFKTNSTR